MEDEARVDDRRFSTASSGSCDQVQHGATYQAASSHTTCYNRFLEFFLLVPLLINDGTLLHA
jgi:hypothetical protein